MLKYIFINALPTPKLTGSVIDLLEHCLFHIDQYGVDMCAFYTSLPINFVEEIIKNRYSNTKPINIININSIEEVYIHPDDVIITNRMMLIRHKIFKSLNYNNRIHAFDTSMSFDQECDINYSKIEKKLWFDGISSNNPKPNIYFNLISLMSDYTEEEIDDIINTLNGYNKHKVIMIMKTQFIEFIKKFSKLANYEIVFDNFKEPFFDQFDTYFYYKASKHYDYSPRLFLECKYLNKEIIYVNRGADDGSTIRNNSNWEDYKYTKNDVVCNKPEQFLESPNYFNIADFSYDKTKQYTIMFFPAQSGKSIIRQGAPKLYNKCSQKNILTENKINMFALDYFHKGTNYNEYFLGLLKILSELNDPKISVSAINNGSEFVLKALQYYKFRIEYLTTYENESVELQNYKHDNITAKLISHIEDNIKRYYILLKILNRLNISYSPFNFETCFGANETINLKNFIEENFSEICVEEDFVYPDIKRTMNPTTSLIEYKKEVEKVFGCLFKKENFFIDIDFLVSFAENQIQKHKR